MKKVILAAFAVCAMFASCSNDEGNNTGDTKNLRIQLPDNFTANSRAVENLVGTGTTTDIKNLTVFLMNGNSVVDVKSFSTSTTFTFPIDIQNVSGSVNKVLVVANVPTADQSLLESKSSEADIRNFPFTVASQSTAGIADKVHIGSSSNFTSAPQIGTNNYYTVVVDLNAITARLEIGPITAGTGIVSSSLQLHGVWINKYWDWTLSTPGIVNNPASGGSVDYWALPAGTPANLAMSSQYTFPVNPINTYSPSQYYDNAYNIVVDGTTNCFAYTLFTGSTGYVPQLVMLISGEYETGYYTGSNKYFFGWVTFNKFKNDVPPNDYITAILPNKIYKAVGGIEVEPSWVTVNPNLGDIDLGIRVNIVEWTEVNVTPEV